MSPSPAPLAMPRLTETAAAQPPSMTLRPMPLPLARPPAPGPRPEAERALDLIGEVSGLLPSLVSQCATLEASIAAARQKHQADVGKIGEVALQWQRLAEGLKEQTAQLATATAAYKRRAETAEAETVSLMAEADRLKRATRDTAAVNSLFQQKILSSFGAGSTGRAAIESARRSAKPFA